MLSEVKTVAFICMESLGRELAYASAICGYRTVLKDVSEARLASAIREFADSLSRQFLQGQVSAEAHNSALANLCIAPCIEDAIRGTNLIIETSHDEAEVKLELFTLFDKFALPDAILVSSCSASISIAELAAVTFCPERCIGLRVQQRGPQRKLFELVKGSQTSDQTAAKCANFLHDLAKDCIVRCEQKAPQNPPVTDNAEPDAFTIGSEPR
jgi:3-hydroxybutyryl-CoA dehydrogenase